MLPIRFPILPEKTLLFLGRRKSFFVRCGMFSRCEFLSNRVFTFSFKLHCTPHSYKQSKFSSGLNFATIFNILLFRLRNHFLLPTFTLLSSSTDHLHRTEHVYCVGLIKYHSVNHLTQLLFFFASSAPNERFWLEWKTRVRFSSDSKTVSIDWTHSDGRRGLSNWTHVDPLGIYGIFQSDPFKTHLFRLFLNEKIWKLSE